jgi:Tfp pilus assembly protein PilV
MIRTYFGRLRRTPGGSPSAEAGFALLEVLISAVIVALIVIATFTGFDVTQRATADERAHSQADVLAQQDEDRLRSMQIDQLSGLNETHTYKYNGTEYTVKSTGEFLNDTTESQSCVKEAQNASYVRTVSTVTWPALKTRPAVVETGLITPPAGGELLVQVFDGSGAGVSGMSVVAKGPAPSEATVSATTGSSGCVIFASLGEGTYSVTTSQLGYVDKDGNSEPPISQRTATVTSGTTTKKQFQFGRAGELTVKFVNSEGTASEGDSFVTFNTGITTGLVRGWGVLGANAYAGSKTTSKTLFPFSSKYAVYAGTCTADAPPEPILEHQGVSIPPGESASVNVIVPPVKLQVFSGSSSGSPGSKVENGFTGSFTDTGVECRETPTGIEAPPPHTEENVHPFSTGAVTTGGELLKPMPFGKFTLCVASKAKVGAPSEYRRLRGIAIENETPTGTPTYTIYLGAGEHQSGSAFTCP